MSHAGIPGGRSWLNDARMLDRAECAPKMEIEKLDDHARNWAEWQTIELGEVVERQGR